MSRGEKLKLLVFTQDFCLDRLRGMNNAKSDNKYNNTNMQPILAKNVFSYMYREE